VENSGLTACGGLNVLIGKNNAGKSNLLAAIELLLRHLKRGLAATILSSRRATEQFTDRDVTKPYRIAIEFDLPSDVNVQLRERLSKEAPHLDRSIEQIKANSNIVFVLTGVSDGNEAWLFLEQIVVGTLGNSDEEELKVEGIRLLSVPSAVGRELAHLLLHIGSLGADLKRLQQLATDRRWLEYAFERKDRLRATYGFSDAYQNLSRDTTRAIENGITSVPSIDGVVGLLNQISAEIKDAMDQLKKKETEGSMTAFAGPAKSTPAYVIWLMEQYGAASVLHLQETKAPIGKEEADTLLDMKLQRGGMERLQTLQQTVRALLGVAVDAFQARVQGGERTAEMDVDNFIVEANGAGIRESLRLILDLELKKPELLLVEEPEVHLHPGLARVMSAYLREKSQDIQMFVTTHSTEFVDSVAFQNAYLISRDVRYKTICQSISSSDGPLLLSTELGLRLSTVFMFDRLVFVEGPSDEAVLRSVAKNLGIDLTKSNIGFVHMTGVRNFAHFAAQATLDLLSRRQIGMWFITDRDERDDEEVKKMMAKLGNRATLKVLPRRELENYLLDETAVKKFLDDKRLAAGLTVLTDSPQTVKKTIEQEAASLQSEVVRLRLANRLLSPVFLNLRTNEGSLEERIKAAAETLNGRLARVETEKAAFEGEVAKVWNSMFLDLAPGTQVLEKTAARYGVTFAKDKGDSERLAQLLQPDAVPYDLRELLREITAEDSGASRGFSLGQS